MPTNPKTNQHGIKEVSFCPGVSNVARNVASDSSYHVDTQLAAQLVPRKKDETALVPRKLGALGPVIVYTRVTSVVTLNSSTSSPMSEYELPRKRYSLYLIHVFRSY
jgi:hypothetical protein